MEYDQVPVDLLEKAARRFELKARSLQGKDHRRGKVVTISRLFGAGAEEILPHLGEDLGWMVWDDQILDLLVNESHHQYQKRMFKALDERAQNWIEDIIATFSERNPEEEYVTKLPHTLHMIATMDSVIVGRASHLFLPSSFRVFIKSSRANRRRYLEQKLGLTSKEAEVEIDRRDENRQKFIEQMARQYELIDRKYRDEYNFDLELNTDSINPVDAAEIIACAARKKLGIH